LASHWSPPIFAAVGILGWNREVMGQAGNIIIIITSSRGWKECWKLCLTVKIKPDCEIVVWPWGFFNYSQCSSATIKCVDEICDLALHFDLSAEV
jgi:hypothetical protein